MRFPFRAIATGIIAGMTFFFFPFLFRVLIVVLFIGLIIRFFGGLWWRRSWYDRRADSFYPGDYDGKHPDEIVPIDGKGYRAFLHRRNDEILYKIK